MEPFTIQIARLVTRVHPMFSSTRDYCRSYLSELAPEFDVVVTAQDLVREQELAELEAMEEGLRLRKFSDPFLERAVIQRKIARELLRRNTILLHGSTVAVDGAAYLFTAPCGTGKSTHTRLWREALGDRAVMVNDDRAFLRISDDGVIAYGSPWSGKHGLDSNIALPIKGICFLRRGPENAICRAQGAECIRELQHQCFLPEDTPGQDLARTLVEQLSRQAALWQMECTKDPAAARLAHQAMSAV